jgi:hypothetical protein
MMAVAGSSGRAGAGCADAEDTLNSSPRINATGSMNLGRAMDCNVMVPLSFRTGERAAA